VSRDTVYLKHIIDEVHFLRSVSKGLRKTSLKKDPVRQRAIARSLEVVGEAVKNLSDDFKQLHPKTDWRSIAGLRDKLIHHYFGIDWDVVWDILKMEIPKLEGTVTRALQERD
jgi:uncharacterized protein with HEPN domain